MSIFDNFEAAVDSLHRLCRTAYHLETRASSEEVLELLHGNAVDKGNFEKHLRTYWLITRTVNESLATEADLMLDALRYPPSDIDPFYLTEDCTDWLIALRDSGLRGSTRYYEREVTDFSISESERFFRVVLGLDIDVKSKMLAYKELLWTL